jgi:sarcosine oxidase gamma subunit
MRPGHYGVAGTPGVIAQRREGLAVVTIVTRKDAGSRLAADMQSAFGITPPLTPHAVTSGGITVVGIGPGRMLAVADVPHDFAQSLGAHAAVTEQSDANVVFDLSGPKVRMTPNAWPLILTRPPSNPATPRRRLPLTLALPCGRSTRCRPTVF